MFNLSSHKPFPVVSDTLKDFLAHKAEYCGIHHCTAHLVSCVQPPRTVLCASSLRSPVLISVTVICP